MEETPWQKLWSSSGLKTRSWPNRLWPSQSRRVRGRRRPASQAAAAERQRLADIDAVAGVFDAELVREAKYGDTPCTAQELAYRAAVKAAAQGKSFLAGLMADAANSGAAGVGATPPPSDKGNKAETPEQCMAEARREVKALLGRKEA